MPIGFSDDSTPPVWIDVERPKGALIAIDEPIKDEFRPLDGL